MANVMNKKQIGELPSTCHMGNLWWFIRVNSSSPWYGPPTQTQWAQVLVVVLLPPTTTTTRGNYRASPTECFSIPLESFREGGNLLNWATAIYSVPQSPRLILSCQAHTIAGMFILIADPCNASCQREGRYAASWCMSLRTKLCAQGLEHSERI